MPLTALKGMNLPENGTGAVRLVTLCQYGTKPWPPVNATLDRM